MQYGVSSYGTMPYAARTIALVTQAADESIVYRAVMRKGGYSDLALPIANFQATMRYGETSFVSATVPASSDYASDIADRSDGGVLIIQTALKTQAQSIDDVTWAELSQVDITDTSIYTGTSSVSTIIQGSRLQAVIPKIVTLPVASYTSTQGGQQYRCAVEFNVRPGDRATLYDNTTMVVGTISYVVDAQTDTMTATELTDSDLLAALPW